MRGWINFWLALACAVAAARELHAQGYLIPDTTRRDVVFDFAGQNLYYSTSNGLIKTFHLSARAFGRSYNLGGSLWGIDIARDDSFILAGQDNVTTNQGTFQRVNLATGAVTNIHYTLASYEGGGWYVAIGSNGLALVTTQYEGDGYTPLRQINLSTNAITIRTDAPGPAPWPGYVDGNTQIRRSADGTRLLFMESNVSNGPVFTYSTTTDTFGPSSNTDVQLDDSSGALNHNGSLIGLRREFSTLPSLDTAPDFHYVRNFNQIDSGIAFDGVRDVFYGINRATDEIIAYSTTTYVELFRLAIGEHLSMWSIEFGVGTLVASPDGHWLALETDSGIRLFAIPNL